MQIDIYLYSQSILSFQIYQRAEKHLLMSTNKATPNARARARKRQIL